MGSEMCIRDSAHGVLDRRRGDEEALGQLQIAVVLQHAGVSHFRHCLLYTSDAADERSSVDLGGRRIIKKKKHV